MNAAFNKIVQEAKKRDLEIGATDKIKTTKSAVGVLGKFLSSDWYPFFLFKSITTHTTLL